MKTEAELLKRVKQETGVELERGSFTQTVTLDKVDARGYVLNFMGPYFDPEDDDFRLYITHRLLDGTETFSLSVQDADDDAWLNGGVVPKYRAGWAFWFIEEGV